MEEYIHIQSIEQLHKCYMPFIKNGGLFVPTETEFKIQDELSIKLQLFEDLFTLKGKVVWINPKNTNLSSGIGIQFCNAKRVHSRIKDLLADFHNHNNATETM